jgi:DNA anti-recombination protein RmuC
MKKIIWPALFFTLLVPGLPAGAEDTVQNPAATVQQQIQQIKDQTRVQREADKSRVKAEIEAARQARSETRVELSQLKAQHRQAVQTGNKDQAKALNSQIQALKKENKEAFKETREKIRGHRKSVKENRKEAHKKIKELKQEALGE